MERAPLAAVSRGGARGRGWPADDRADGRRSGASGRDMKDPNEPCLFCTPRGVTRRNALAYAARDSYPVSPGHTLIIPFRHCASFFELTPEEHAACMALLRAERQVLDVELKPDGYNVGVNIGRAAGQSIFHVHVHLIPRFAGDHPGPQGGVRHVLPAKAHYRRE